MRFLQDEEPVEYSTRNDTNQAQDTLFFHISLLFHLCVSLVRLSFLLYKYSCITSHVCVRLRGPAVASSGGAGRARGTPSYLVGFARC